MEEYAEIFEKLKGKKNISRNDLFFIFVKETNRSYTTFQSFLKFATLLKLIELQKDRTYFLNWKAIEGFYAK